MGKEARRGQNQAVQPPATMDQLVRGCRSFFTRLSKTYPKAPQSQYSLVDCLGTALSMFVLKYPSLYRYLQDLGQVQDEFTAPYAQAFRRRALRNIRHLFGVARVPTDTTIRRRVDEVRTPDLLGLFRVLTAWITKHRLWSKLPTSEGRLLVALDGTQLFSSAAVNCVKCRQTRHRDGQVTYRHQQVSAVVVHPVKSTVLPLGAEPISQAPGQPKQACEYVAGQRLLRRLGAEYSKLRLCVVADALYANAPTVRLLQELKLDFILAVKPSQGRQSVFAYDAVSGYAEAKWHRASAMQAQQERLPKDRGTLEYRILRERSLNAANPAVQVTVIQCQRRTRSGCRVVGEWITNLPVTVSSVAIIVRYARRRWMIENGVFKAMKDSTGGNFEHNFGHGKASLCDNFGQLMVAAWLMDQLCLLTCKYYHAIRHFSTAWAAQWERQRTYLFDCEVSTWLAFYKFILKGVDPPELNSPD